MMYGPMCRALGRAALWPTMLMVAECAWAVSPSVDGQTPAATTQSSVTKPTVVRASTSAPAARRSPSSPAGAIPNESDGLRLPATLHGTWEIGPEPCKLPGNPDSDSRLVIDSNKIGGYEDWSEILAITQVASLPPTWKLKTRQHYHEDMTELELIVSVTGTDQDTLVIVDESRGELYVRCT